MLTKVLAFCWLAAAAQAADISGQWILHLNRAGEEFSPARVELKVDNGKLTGTLNELILAGTVKGDDLEIVATRPDGDEVGKMKGKIVGSEAKGKGQGARAAW